MKILLSIAAALMITSSVAQESGVFTLTGEMSCDRNGIIIRTIAEDYKEKPLMMGKSTDGINIVLVANEKTKTWTILAIKDKTTCILALGTDLTQFGGKPIKYHVVH